MSPKKRKTILILSVFALVVGSFVYFLIKASNKDGFAPGPSPEKFTNEFVKQMSEGNSTATYALLTDNLKVAFPEAIWQKQVDYAKEHYPEKCQAITVKEIPDPGNLYEDSDPFRSLCDISLESTNYYLDLVILKKNDGYLIDETVLRKK